MQRHKTTNGKHTSSLQLRCAELYKLLDLLWLNRRAGIGVFPARLLGLIAVRIVGGAMFLGLGLGGAVPALETREDAGHGASMLFPLVPVT